MNNSLEKWLDSFLFEPAGARKAVGHMAVGDVVVSILWTYSVGSERLNDGISGDFQRVVEKGTFDHSVSPRTHCSLSPKSLWVLEN